LATKTVKTRIKTPNIVPIVDAHDQELIREAAEHLEHPSLAARLSNAIGTPMEVAFELMPRTAPQHTSHSRRQSQGYIGQRKSVATLTTRHWSDFPALLAASSVYRDCLLNCQSRLP
jgi:hypothetical protein